MRKFSFKVHSLKEVLSKLFPDGMIIVDAAFLSPSMLVELSWTFITKVFEVTNSCFSRILEQYNDRYFTKVIHRNIHE